MNESIVALLRSGSDAFASLDGITLICDDREGMDAEKNMRLFSEKVLPELQSLAGTSCKLLDLGQLKPGDPAFVQFSNTLRPILNQCANITSQIGQGIKTPTLNLPFGILSTDNQQRRGAVPGTVPGTPAPGLSGGPR